MMRRALVGAVILSAISLMALGCDDDATPDTTQYAGLYQGTWGTEDVPDYGTWEVTVNATGGASGVGNEGEFDIEGTVSSTGVLTFGATYRGSDATSTFTGNIDEAGVVSGTWTETDGSGGGIFSGERVD